MNAEQLFLREISKLKRIVFIKFVYRIMLWALLIFLCAGTIVRVVEETGISQHRLIPVIIICSAIILFAAFLLAIIRKKDFLNVLIDIDTRLNLRDRIATAYEYQRSGIKSVFSDLLMRDAAARLRQFNTRDVLPARFSGLHILVLLMFITGVALYSSDFGMHTFKSVPDHQKKIEKARALVRNYTMSRSEDKKSQRAEHNNAHDRIWQHLKKTIADPNLTRERLSGTLNEFLKEIQAEQARLADELGSKLRSAEIDEMLAQNVADLQNFSASNLEKLKMLLKQSLNHPGSDSANQDIETLQDLKDMEKLLSQILDEFNQEKSLTEALAESGHPEKQIPGSSEDPGKMPLLTRHSKRAGEAAGKKRGGMDNLGRPGFDASRAEEPGGPDDMGLGDGLSSAAGHAKSAGKKKARHELDKSNGPALQDKMNSSQVKNYLIQIRSLTAIGESKLKEENILRDYRREIESVLQKEDMPLNYRKYIKQYFTSIGMTTADSQLKSSQGSDQ